LRVRISPFTKYINLIQNNSEYDRAMGKIMGRLWRVVPIVESCSYNLKNYFTVFFIFFSILNLPSVFLCRVLYSAKPLPSVK
jgi:hypothetical protein